MKIQLCPGLWLDSLDKCLMQLENGVAPVACQSTWQEALGTPQRPQNDLP